jgi:DNA-binding CsgD family transcriptional regulator
VHAGFFARLAEKMPGLTPAETRFMALHRLGMNSKEMAAMLGVGAEAIRQVRMRVRRKAGAGEEGDLEKVAREV